MSNTLVRSNAREIQSGTRRDRIPRGGAPRPRLGSYSKHNSKNMAFLFIDSHTRSLLIFLFFPFCAFCVLSLTTRCVRVWTVVGSLHARIVTACCFYRTPACLPGDNPLSCAGSLRAETFLRPRHRTRASRQRSMTIIAAAPSEASTRRLRLSEQHAQRS